MHAGAGHMAENADERLNVADDDLLFRRTRVPGVAIMNKLRVKCQDSVIQLPCSIGGLHLTTVALGCPATVAVRRPLHLQCRPDYFPFDPRRRAGNWSASCRWRGGGVCRRGRPGIGLPQRYTEFGWESRSVCGDSSHRNSVYLVRRRQAQRITPKGDRPNGPRPGARGRLLRSSPCWRFSPG